MTRKQQPEISFGLYLPCWTQAWRIAGDLAGLIGPTAEFLQEGNFGGLPGMYALRLWLKGLKENSDNLRRRFGVGGLVAGVFALVENGEPKRACP